MSVRERLPWGVRWELLCTGVCRRTRARLPLVPSEGGTKEGIRVVSGQRWAAASGFPASAARRWCPSRFPDEIDRTKMFEACIRKKAPPKPPVGLCVLLGCVCVCVCVCARARGGSPPPPPRHTPTRPPPTPQRRGIEIWLILPVAYACLKD